MEKLINTLTALCLLLVVLFLGHTHYQALSNPTETTPNKELIELKNSINGVKSKIQEKKQEQMNQLNNDLLNLKDENIVIKRQLEELSGTLTEMQSPDQKTTEAISKLEENIKKLEECSKAKSETKSEVKTQIVKKIEKQVIFEKIGCNEDLFFSCMQDMTSKWHSTCSKNVEPKVSQGTKTEETIINNTKNTGKEEITTNIIKIEISNSNLNAFCGEKADKWVLDCKEKSCK
jgi:chromosome segregation ATPase